ncbi:hypothetical protein [Varunaivibrio sulfuroxidans]|uniref:Uncharacterized protein n=1 Tax=Varunaivibrio sulfuroxidans TaxID=1773489 RepID=A0A4R3JAC0_9PROT|nr:hypothetical protein [Varunaivibrio sulfuroxidans]TCS62562.1 hypothetical protein EDD55_105108 [Varunaivibrio sulfuroxidans]WES30768.1 hypothetical protein P3M64_14225 [Varunaivibrio sulfuroxidans]
MNALETRVALATLPTIKRAVAREFCVHDRALDAKWGGRQAVRARWVAIHLACRVIGLQAALVAAAFGCSAATVYRTNQCIAEMRREADTTAQIRKLTDFTRAAIARARRFAAFARPPEEVAPTDDDAMDGAPETLRTCLKCRKAFAADGPFNRICPPCARVNANASGSLGGLYL